TFRNRLGRGAPKANRAAVLLRAPGRLWLQNDWPSRSDSHWPTWVGQGHTADVHALEESKFHAESSPNTAPGSVTLAISTPSLTTGTAPSLRISNRPVVDAALSTV